MLRTREQVMQSNIMLGTSDESQNGNIQVMTMDKKFLIGTVIVTPQWV